MGEPGLDLIIGLAPVLQGPRLTGGQGARLRGARLRSYAPKEPSPNKNSCLLRSIFGLIGSLPTGSLR